MEKRTKFVKSQPEVAPEVKNDFLPYTNHCSFSGKLGEDPVQKNVGGYVVVSFSFAVWQPRDKPVMWLKVLCHDADIQIIAMKLKKGRQCIIMGKLTYDTFNGSVHLGLFANDIQTQVQKEV